LQIETCSILPLKERCPSLRLAELHAGENSPRLTLFPRFGCEELLGQMFNLGVESHDDLNDALLYLLQGLVSQGLELLKIYWIET
jgi:hypothetical protein